MQSEKIILQIQDEEYAKAFARGIGERCKNFICKINCNEKGNIEETSKESVIAESLENPDYLVAKGIDIYKYQSMNEILHQLEQALGLNFNLPQNENHQIIGIINVDGGAGASSVAMSLALTEKLYYEKKVMLINLSNFGYGLKNSNDGRLIYELETSIDSFKNLRIFDWIWQNEEGVFVIGAEKGINTLSLVSTENKVKIIDNLLKLINPELTVLDFGSSGIREIKEMSKFYQGLIGIHHGNYKKERQEALEFILGKLDFTVINRAELTEGSTKKLKEKEEGFFNENERKLFHLEEVGNIDLNNSFGLGISILAEAMS